MRFVFRFTKIGENLEAFIFDNDFRYVLVLKTGFFILASKLFGTSGGF